MSKKIAAIIVLCLAVMCAVLLPAYTTRAGTVYPLAQQIDAILKQGPPCNWAIEVVSLDMGEILYARNARTPMVPASNMKLLTTSAALFYLGPDFKAKTSFYIDGELDSDGVLHGNLIMYGRGDPNISGRFEESPTTIFEQIAESLKSLGLREIKGDIIGDDSCFDDQYYGPWKPEESHRWYAARVSALSFNDNCLDICVSPGPQIGSRARVTQSPPTSYVRLLNQVTTTQRKSNSPWISPSRDGSTIVVNGKMWSKQGTAEFWSPVQLPPLYAATVFMETLERSGIPVSGEAYSLGADHVSAVSPDAEPFFEHESLPLSEMIKVVNKRSQNLHAELLFKQIGLRSGMGPSFEGGAKAVETFLETAGIDIEPISVHDGSGLSRKNRASAHSFVQLLRFMDRSPWGDDFRNSLAVGGVDDLLKNMTWVVPAGKVAGKTGSLNGVVAFSGYAENGSGGVVFSMIANGFTKDSYKIKQCRDKICALLVNY